MAFSLSQVRVLLYLSISLFPIRFLLSQRQKERKSGDQTQSAMGRAKLEMKYRENARARLSTHMTRMKGLKKKAGELSVLCGVDVLLASFSPELNTLQFWPEQGTLEFTRIRERYLRFRQSEMKTSDISCNDNQGDYDNINQHIPSIPMPPPPNSFPSSSFLEEMVAMDAKLKEVRERISFLQASSSSI